MTENNVIASLKVVLSDTYSLYLKTQNYHWNVQGVHFKSLHALFEDQYTELATAVDDIAEMIRALGVKVPGTFSDFLSLTTLEPADGNAADSEMVQDLAADQDKIQATLKRAHDAAQANDDDIVVDAMIQRMSVHRKNKWMLKSSL